MLNLSILNPSKKYPRRYNVGHFLKLSRRYSRSTGRLQHSPAKMLFNGIFGSRALQKWHKSFFGHPLVPLLLSIAIAVTGHNAALVRSVGLIICALWVAIDIGIWVSAKSWSIQWKSIQFSVTSCALFCGAMVLMWWFLSSTLQDQRDDAYRNLQFEHYSIGRTDEPMETTFSVRNYSGQIISKKHRMNCFIREFISNDEAPIIFTGLTMFKANGSWYTTPAEDPVQAHIPSDEVMEPGGDADTEDCLGFLRYRGATGTQCVDVRVTFWYALENQQDIEQEKRFQYVGYRDKNSNITWHPVLTDSQEDYCSAQERPPN
jgi:hypothetical protein